MAIVIIPNLAGMFNENQTILTKKYAPGIVFIIGWDVNALLCGCGGFACCVDYFYCSGLSRGVLFLVEVEDCAAAGAADFSYF